MIVDGGIGGKVHCLCTLLHSIGGVDWEAWPIQEKNLLWGEGADVGLLGVVGMNGMLEWGNIPDKVPMDTEKAASKTNGDVYSNMGDTCFKNMSYKCN